MTTKKAATKKAATKRAATKKAATTSAAPEHRAPRVYVRETFDSLHADWTLRLRDLRFERCSFVNGGLWQKAGHWAEVERLTFEDCTVRNRGIGNVICRDVTVRNVKRSPTFILRNSLFDRVTFEGETAGPGGAEIWRRSRRRIPQLSGSARAAARADAQSAARPRYGAPMRTSLATRLRIFLDVFARRRDVVVLEHDVSPGLGAARAEDWREEMGAVVGAEVVRFAEEIGG